MTLVQKEGIVTAAREYIPLREAHSDQFLPNSFAYTDAERVREKVSVPVQ